MSKLPAKLRYGDKLEDGRYVILTQPADGDKVRIIFVGGTSEVVPSDKEVELRKAAK